MTTTDEPQGEPAITQARIGSLLHDLRTATAELIRIYNTAHGRSLAPDDEAEITEIRNALDWLRSDIQESRKLRVVR